VNIVESQPQATHSGWSYANNRFDNRSRKRGTFLLNETEEYSGSEKTTLSPGFPAGDRQRFLKPPPQPSPSNPQSHIQIVRICECSIPRYVFDGDEPVAPLQTAIATTVEDCPVLPYENRSNLQIIGLTARSPTRTLREFSN